LGSRKNSGNIVRVYRTNIDPSLGLGSMTFVGIGIIVDEAGIMQPIKQSLLLKAENIFHLMKMTN
jgi:hypothetical protein